MPDDLSLVCLPRPLTSSPLWDVNSKEARVKVFCSAFGRIHQSDHCVPVPAMGRPAPQRAAGSSSPLPPWPPPVSLPQPSFAYFFFNCLPHSLSLTLLPSSFLNCSLPTVLFTCLPTLSSGPASLTSSPSPFPSFPFSPASLPHPSSLASLTFLYPNSSLILLPCLPHSPFRLCFPPPPDSLLHLLPSLPPSSSCGPTLRSNKNPAICLLPRWCGEPCRSIRATLRAPPWRTEMWGH